MAFVVGLLAMAAVLWWLYRLKQRDLAQCAEVLGLAVVSNGEQRRGTTPEGFAFYERAVLSGTLHGRPATLWSRTVRRPAAVRRPDRSSQFTVLQLTLAQPVRTPLRLQPAGVLTGLETMLQGAATDVVAIAPEFDAAYVTYAPSATAAVMVLDAAMQQRLLAFRRGVAGDLPTNAAGHLSSGLVLGTFQVDGITVTYSLFGSPLQATAQHVKAAAPVLLALAEKA